MVSPSSTTSYWVRVTGQCGSPANSNTATVTVQACVDASISSQPQNKTINMGSSTSLSVTAAGSSPFTYQWYIGNSGDTSTPTGTNSSSLTVSPSTTTSYWVRVTGQCGSPANSNTATVTVSPCPDVAITSASATSAGGSQVTLSANASSGVAGGVLEYRWYRGDTPGSGGSLVGVGKSITVTISATTSFWVRVSNQCGAHADSDVVVAALCQLPVITTQPADQTIASGAMATLTVAAAGSGWTVAWYKGTSPDKSTPAGTGPSIVVGPLTATTTYWAGVKNSCDEVPTRNVTITVQTQACTGPAITTQPLSQKVKGGTRR